MTAPTDVDRSAPVIAVHEIDIEAPRDTVWRLHADVNAWPTWQTLRGVDSCVECYPQCSVTSIFGYF